MERVIDKENVTGRYLAFNLASLITSYPDDSFIDEFNKLMNQKELKKFCSEKTRKSWKELKIFLKKIENGKGIFNGSPGEYLDDIRSDYIDIFDRGKSANSLYETEYGKERIMAKTNELADLAGFYKAFGLNNDSDEVIFEMGDHVSVELEFYGYMIMKQIFLEENMINEGVEIVLDGRKKFLNDHLGRFVKSISQRPGVIENDYFSKVFNWIGSLVDNECNDLEVTPDIVEWISSQAEPEVVECVIANCGLAGANKMT